MRSPLLLISLAGLAIHAPLVAAQEAPRVLFCAGQCTAVDQKGVRTPAPKGTQLRPGQRLETGPGSYAQLKIGQGAVGIGEQARLGLDAAGGADVVTLERGRVRVLDGESFGGIGSARSLQLRTPDGNLNLRGADIEVRGVSRAEQGEAMTLVKLNAGDARLVSLQGDVALKTDSVQSLSGGTLTARTFPVTAIAPIAPATTGRTPTTAPLTAPLTLPPVVLSIAPTFTMPARVDPTLPANTVPKLGNPASPPVLTLSDALAGLPVKDPTTDQTVPLATAYKNVTSPSLTTTTPTTTATTTTTAATTFTIAPTTTTTNNTIATISSTPTQKTGTTGTLTFTRPPVLR
jgi:hypothetical protein